MASGRPYGSNTYRRHFIVRACSVLMHVVSQRARVLRVGRTDQLAITRLSCCLPPLRNRVGILIHRPFEAQLPGPPIPIYASTSTSRCSPARLKAEMESLSAFLGLFHSPVGSRTGAVRLGVRLQSPPHQTQRADFPHWAYLPASHRGLCGRFVRERFRE